MARGWESKAVESQIESAGERASARLAHIELTEQQAEAIRERDCLQLSRIRILNDLQSAMNPKYREMLQKSLQFLDDKLAALDAVANRPDLPA